MDFLICGWGSRKSKNPEWVTSAIDISFLNRIMLISDTFNRLKAFLRIEFIVSLFGLVLF
jgi:hypothetical protein